MSKVGEDFELQSGGLFDDFDGKIESAHFGPPTGDYAKASGTTEVGLYLAINNPEAENPIEQFWSIGKGWSVQDDGKSVSNDTKPESHAFIKNSNGGKLVERMIKLLGGGDYDKGVEVVRKRDRYMTEAEFYPGYAFHFKREDVTITIDKSEKHFKVLLPQKLVEMKETSTSSQSTASKSAAPKTKASKPAEPQKESAEGDTVDLDMAVASLASDKLEKDLKREVLKAVRDPNSPLKGAPATYVKGIVDGSVLKRLEEEGILIKGEEDKYI